MKNSNSTDKKSGNGHPNKGQRTPHPVTGNYSKKIKRGSS